MKKKWIVMIIVAVSMAFAGCGGIMMLEEEPNFTYGDRSADSFSAYFQGMERVFSEAKQEELKKEWQALPEWDGEEAQVEVQEAWIAFEERLRMDAIPMGYADLETFFATEREALGDENYQRAMQLLEQWFEIPEGAEENEPVEAALDRILEDQGLSFGELVDMVNEHEALIGAYRVSGHDMIADDPVWLKPMEKSGIQNRNIREIWTRIQTVMPETLLARVREFAVVTDGEENTMAYVVPLDENAKTWSLTVDYLDMVDEAEKLDLHAGDETLFHEFGHILSLNETQMDPDAKGSLDLDEGSMAVLSYLNRFYQHFWRGLEREWQTAVEAEDAEGALFDFFLAHEEAFLNDYAATSPAEDFAEMFAQFVLQERPQARRTRLDQKIEFFYQFPELVEMRSFMRNGIKILEEAA